MTATPAITVSTKDSKNKNSGASPLHVATAASSTRHDLLKKKLLNGLQDKNRFVKVVSDHEKH
ncbi:hypothetical protein E2C01_057400 [Portunus trituberculatus]|uniref:Uncharacterized protein n=1 Tax=Portunus trituberculatus TaxID=210409 RepID=A0A5B7GZW2_PORTR|nr:hypothetical protein [Portunus trituberculatus]